MLGLEGLLGREVMSFYLNNVCHLLTGPEQFSLTHQTRSGNLDLPADLTEWFPVSFSFTKRSVARLLKFVQSLYI